MPSHTEYIADQSEEQLQHLIEVAKLRLDNLQAGGWVWLWVVCDALINRAWFADDDYAGAVAYLVAMGGALVLENKPSELGLQRIQVRPAEAARLLARTQAEQLKQVSLAVQALAAAPA